MINRLEADEQKDIFYTAYLMRNVYPELRLLFAIPNGGSRHPAEAAHLQQQGVKAGIPDMCLPVARGGYHGLYIELKRVKGGKVSEKQMQWINDLNAQGYLAKVCYGADDALETLKKYLRGELINGF